MGLCQGARGDHLTASAEDAEWAFSAYEAVRHRLPSLEFPRNAKRVETLGDLVPQFDVFLLDAFGVLNVGESAIPGALDRIEALRNAGKHVVVVSNAASYPKRILLDRYKRLGFTFSAEDVFTSREVLLTAMRTRAPRRLGLMLPDAYGLEEMEHLDAVFLADDPAVYDDVEEILLIGSGEWTEGRQSMLEKSLIRNPRPVLVGNPDIVAPRETGLSREPGHYAHRLADVIGLAPEFYGKPFANIFEFVLARLPEPIKRSRMIMVGDTLQTDILGGRAAGLTTALITNFGSLAALDPAAAAKRSGIVPDFILPEP